MEALRTIARQQGTTISAEKVLAVMAEEVWPNSNWRSGGDFVTTDGEEEDEEGCTIYRPCNLIAHALIEMGWQAFEMADWNEYDLEEIIQKGDFPDVHLFAQEAIAVFKTVQLFSDTNTWGQCLAKARKNNELSGLGRN